MAYEAHASVSTLRLRARLLARARAFFAERGVLEIETPALGDCATTDPAIESFAIGSPGGKGTPQWLQTSPEPAMKRLLAQGAGDIYQICRVFRDAELGRWHQPEFTLLEWYRVGWTETALMDEVRELVVRLLDGHVAPSAHRALSYRDAFIEHLDLDPFSEPREIEAALKRRGAEVPKGLDGNGLLDLALGTLLVPAFDPASITFVYDYPASQAALARIKPGAPPVAARFELFLGGLELANGFHELADPIEQRRRFEAELETRRQRGQPLPPIDEDFLAALAEGLPDCAGVALGFDRLVALAAGAGSLAEAVAFAHGPPAS